MYKNWLKSSLLLLIVFCFSVGESNAQNETEHIEVVMRKIGHQLLLNSSDSSSRVLPIVSQDGKFRIQFATEFEFLPSKMAKSIDSIINVTGIANSYRVEVLNKENDEIVYSYEIDPFQTTTDIACGPRRQPKAEYDLLFTILDRNESMIPEENSVLEQTSVSNNNSGSVRLIWILVLILIFSGIGFYFWKRRSRQVENTNEVRIGAYRFDEHNMRLSHKNITIDLTSKETDLLKLLHSSLNNTLERDEILKVVWGDEGDYVGRTLDVFISKLRKKFSEDASVKIINVRGVGYKMILSE